MEEKIEPNLFRGVVDNYPKAFLYMHGDDNGD